MFHFGVEVFSFPLSDMGLTRRRSRRDFQFSVVRYKPHAEGQRARRGILGQFITKTGFCWFLLIWGLISLTRRRRGLAEEYWNLGV